MKLEHVNIFTAEHMFRMGSIEIHRDKITGVAFDEASGWEEDALYAVPGFIDMHLHGCLGKDVCDADPRSLRDIAAYQLQNGVTGFAPATLTLSENRLMDVLQTIHNYVNQEKEGAHDSASMPVADILGINMEGPFISHEKKGAQDGRYIRPVDQKLVRQFMRNAGDLVKIIGIAPEQNDVSVIAEILGGGAAGAIPSDGCRPGLHVSLAHTNAAYETAMNAFESGADHVTHLCNAMPVFHHRKPGVVGAAFDACAMQGRKDITVELICDGVHVHPAMVRAVFKLFGTEHIIMVSDSMRGTGLLDGIYKLGELDVEVCGSRALLCGDAAGSGTADHREEDAGLLAGSVTDLFSCVQTAVRQMQIPLEKVIPCVTENPAKKLAVFEERGTIEAGKLADILLLDRKLQLRHVIKSGIML